jgi:hypothetical protein
MPGSSSAYGPSNVNAAGAGVSDIFSGFGDLDKAKAAELEQQQYSEAAAYAGQEEQFARESTALKVAGESRDLLLAQGRTSAAVAGAGLAESGSALEYPARELTAGRIAAGCHKSARINNGGRVRRAAAKLSDHGTSCRQCS